MFPHQSEFNEICLNCGCTFGSHLGTTFWEGDKVKYPKDCCPGHEGRMDWDKGPGTTFDSSGKYVQLVTPKKEPK